MYFFVSVESWSFVWTFLVTNAWYEVVTTRSAYIKDKTIVCRSAASHST